jgi:hypothetical protein
MIVLINIVAGTPFDVGKMPVLMTIKNKQQTRFRSMAKKKAATDA